MPPHVRTPNSPDDLLPAQVGILLVRHPVLGHVAATLVDLAERGLLTVTAAENDDWLIASPPRPKQPRQPPERFETALLSMLPPANDPLSLAEDTVESIAPALRKFARELVKDAVHHGWLRRRHRDELTKAGEETAALARELRTRLRRAKTSGDHDTLAADLPTALAFGLLSPDSAPGSAFPLVHFAAAFTRACSDLPDWQHVEPRNDYPDVGAVGNSGNQWGGMPPGGGFAGSW